MKKWLIGCLTVLAMVCLIPGIALNAKAESLYCRYCDKSTDCEILGYEKYDATDHKVHIKCTACGRKDNIILGHDWGEWETLSGMILHGHSCNRCGYYITEVCTGGTATCTAKAVCVVCGGEYGKLAPHQLVTINQPATCQKEGLRYTYCAACRYRTPNIITPIQPHVLKKAREFTREPTCTKPGWKSYYLCTTCTTYSETDWVDKLGHDFVHHDAQAPTCTGIGWDAYDTCSRCNYTTRKELPALNHDLVQHDAQTPTCTEKGWAYETCSRSGCNYITRKELPALNHALVRHEAQAATCTEPGWDAYDTCSNCDYTTYVEIPASGHVLTNYGENWDLVFCPVCGKVENGERLELLETASAAAVDGKLPEGKLVARMNQRYLSLAFVHEGKLTAPAGRVKITLPAEIVQDKRLLLIAPDGTETELPFEIVGEMICFTLDFTEIEIPAVLVLKPL